MSAVTRYNTQFLQEAAAAADTIPRGTYVFEPPLMLGNGHTLKGTPGGTVLQAVKGATGPLIHILSEPAEELLGLASRTAISDLRIIGAGPEVVQYGIQLDGNNVRFDRVEIVDCYLGLVVEWAVDVVVRDSTLRRSVTNLYVPGKATDYTTTLRFEDCNIREAWSQGILIQSGWQIVFDNTIIEANAGAGMVVAARPGHAVNGVYLNQVWFEANKGGDVAGSHAGTCRFENCLRQ